MVRIKICGLVRECDAEYCNEARADYVGLVFAESRRQVDMKQAERIKKVLNQGIQTVGVFVNADITEIVRIAGSQLIDIIQLHGNEDSEYIEKLKKNTSLPVIKAVSVSGMKDIDDAEKLDVDYLLLDSGNGGTGKTFDWSIVRSEIHKPFFAAGGLNADNVLSAVKALNPYAIDISSGAETKGYKDKDKIIEIVRRLRNEQ